MIGKIFYWLLNMSIAGTFSGLIVFLIGKIKAVPKSAAYLLWSIAGVRLCLPVFFGFRFSLMSLISKITSKTIVVFEGTVTPDLSATNYVMAAESYFPTVFRNETLEKVFTAFGIVWAVIASALLISACLVYFSTKSALRDAQHLENNVFCSDNITSPSVIGIFSQRIVIPSYMKNEELSYVLAHENIHIKRHDNLFRSIAVVICCVHWYDPFVWLFLKSFFESLELSCDERVLKGLDETEKKNYALTLLRCEENRSLFVSAFGGAKIRLRIERILSYKKMTWLSACVIALLFAITAIVLLTNAV